MDFYGDDAIEFNETLIGLIFIVQDFVSFVVIQSCTKLYPECTSMPRFFWCCHFCCKDGNRCPMLLPAHISTLWGDCNFVHHLSSGMSLAEVFLAALLVESKLHYTYVSNTVPSFWFMHAVV